MILKVVRPITVKVIVTEELKEKLANDLRLALQRTEAELQQIDAQAKRLLADADKLDSTRVASLKNQLEAEKVKRLDTRKELFEKLKVIAALELGREQVHSTVESIIEVNVGDPWHPATEIVLKNDRIVEIR